MLQRVCCGEGTLGPPTNVARVQFHTSHHTVCVLSLVVLFLERFVFFF